MKPRVVSSLKATSKDSVRIRVHHLVSWEQEAVAQRTHFEQQFCVASRVCDFCRRTMLLLDWSAKGNICRASSRHPVALNASSPFFFPGGGVADLWGEKEGRRREDGHCRL